MAFAFSPQGQEIQLRVAAFFEERLLPCHEEWNAAVQATGREPAFVAELAVQARAEGLWNLGIADLPEGAPGTRLSNLDFAPVAELLGKLPWSSKVFNCHAPDLPNMVLLNAAATGEQRALYLEPLLRGEAISSFAMTEPAVASSDATNIATTIRSEGGDYVINGHKWYITGAAAPELAFHLVVGVTDPEAERNARHSIVIVPAGTPGIEVVREQRFLGWNDHSAPIGELVFRGVRVPKTNLLGQEGRGFAAAQVRLGPARLHHSMRCLGLAEMLLGLMRSRAQSRTAFGRRFDTFDSIQQWIAEARIEIEKNRLFLLSAAEKLDRMSFKDCWREISMVKVSVARMLQRIADRCLQVHGAAGGSDDFLIHHAFVYARMFRIADGPDEVHLRQIYKTEMTS